MRRKMAGARTLDAPPPLEVVLTRFQGRRFPGVMWWTTRMLAVWVFRYLELQVTGREFSGIFTCGQGMSSFFEWATTAFRLPNHDSGDTCLWSNKPIFCFKHHYEKRKKNYINNDRLFSLIKNIVHSALQLL